MAEDLQNNSSPSQNGSVTSQEDDVELATTLSRLPKNKFTSATELHQT